MLRPGNGLVTDMGGERQHLIKTGPVSVEIRGHERGVFDCDSHLFDRCHEEILVLVLAENRREKLNQFEASNRCAKVEPRTITCDPHVQIPAKRRVPQVDRWQSFAFGGANRGGNAFCGRNYTILCAHCFCHFPFERYTFLKPSNPQGRDVMAAAEDLVAEIEALEDKLAQAKTAITRRFIGQERVVELTLTSLLCGGHGLLIGLPGLGKTRLVETVSTVMGLNGNRVQFTPDLMPADILGSEVLETGADGSRTFKFIQGPIFCQLLMADEINRASPRTQSALLQAMQEKVVTVAGETRPLDAPFHVLATQNPIEQEGTYPLPEAQLDRFLVQIDVQYPDRTTEKEILLATTGAEEAEAYEVFTADELIAAQKLLRRMPVGDAVVEMVLDLVRAFRPNDPLAGERVKDTVAWGPGPRAAQALMLTVRARALLEGRLAPAPEDVINMARPVLTHRMALTFSARARGEDLGALIDDVAHGLVATEAAA